MADTKQTILYNNGDRSKVKYAVQDVLKDIEDWRAVTWLVDNMIDGKPSDLSDVLKVREAKINKKLDIAKKLYNYNQPTAMPQKTKKKMHSHDDR